MSSRSESYTLRPNKATKLREKVQTQVKSAGVRLRYQNWGEDWGTQALACPCPRDSLSGTTRSQTQQGMEPTLTPHLQSFGLLLKHQEFKVIFNYTVSWRPAWAPQNPFREQRGSEGEVPLAEPGSTLKEIQLLILGGMCAW